ncbi:MAG: hypothetical protein KIT31_27390 [Deltaproteobacteria bacterium]|nr:hypothetical protein [Deltaproteobacteria bacterium]
MIAGRPALALAAAAALGGCWTGDVKAPAEPPRKPDRLDAKPGRCSDGGDEAQLVALSCRDMRHSRMQRARSGALAVALDRGRLLAIGGDGDGAAATAEMFDPATGWSPVGMPAVFEGIDWAATRLVAHGRDAYFVTASTLREIRVARFDAERREWVAQSPPLDGRDNGTIPHVGAAMLADGSLLVASTDRAALYTNGIWRRLRDLPAAPKRFVRWIAPLAGGDALVDGVLRFDRRRAAWVDVSASASRRVQRGSYAPVALEDGRVALVGGCSDGGECWGNPEIDVFDRGGDAYTTTRALLEREHAVGAQGISLPGARVMMTSDFGGGRNIEHCRVPTDPALASCRCGACSVPERSNFTVVAGEGECMLVLGGTTPHGPTDEVLRYCWSDSPLPAIRTP